MYESCLKKQEQVKNLFDGLESAEERYNKIMELGKEQSKLDSAFKTDSYRVVGCQSNMYLHAFMKEGLLYFETESDALISAGLAQLLVRVYSGEPPESVFKCPPKYLEELGILKSLSPTRSNGLASLLLAMKKHAVKYC